MMILNSPAIMSFKEKNIVAKFVLLVLLVFFTISLDFLSRLIVNDLFLSGLILSKIPGLFDRLRSLAGVSEYESLLLVLSLFMLSSESPIINELLLITQTWYYGEY